MTRSPQDVAAAHLDAVIAGDPTAMAADYADDAVLVRGTEIHRGQPAIKAYFATVPERLGAAVVLFDSVEVSGQIVRFSWHLEGASTPTSGTDTCRIVNGMIVHQSVALDATDF